MIRYLKWVLAAWLLFSAGGTSAELVLIQPGAHVDPSSLASELNAEGRVLIENPHDGSVLLEIAEGRQFDSSGLGRAAIHRDVQNYPTSLPDSVRILVEIDTGLVTREPLRNEFMSFNFGRPFTQACDGSVLARYIDSLDSFGTAVIAAAGNVFDTSTSSATNVNEFWGVDEPACVSSAIAVGATRDYTDTPAVNVWTSYGNFFSTQSHDQLLDYWAPGAYIETPVAAAEIFGTSFSAPHVAGVWTRLRGRYPYASNDYIRSLLASCPLVSDGRGNIPALVTKPRICWKTAWQ